MARTPSERLEDRRRECIAQALEADKMAMAAEPDLREGFLSLAQAWRQLAKEIELAIQERDAGLGN